MANWVIKDYLDAAGRNVIREWMNGLPEEDQLAIDAWIRNIAAVRPLKEPYTKTLDGRCDGLMEFRINGNRVKYRPLAIYGPGKGVITILFGAREIGGRFEPKDACDIAHSHRRVLEEHPGRTREHE